MDPLKFAKYGFNVVHIKKEIIKENEVRNGPIEKLNRTFSHPMADYRKQKHWSEACLYETLKPLEIGL